MVYKKKNMKAYSPEKITCEFYKNAPKNITEVIF